MEIFLLVPLALAVAAIASRLLWSLLHPVRARVLPVTAESEYKTSLTNIGDIIRSFVVRIPNATIRFDPPDVDDLQAKVVEELDALKLDQEMVRPWVRWGCQVAENFYPHHPMDLKVLIVICNLVIFYVDDILTQNHSMLYEFQNNLIKRRPQGHPILDCLVEHLIPRMWHYFDPVAANAITVGFYEFIMGTAMESLTKKMIHHPSAPRFPEYVRLKSGAPAQYAYWIFPRDKHPDVSAYIQAVPDLLAIINRINDILSFYKEELAGEDDNFVHMRAKLAGKDVISTLDDICEETMTAIQNISATLAGDAAAHEAFHGWLARYVHFHLSTSRYHLQELF